MDHVDRWAEERCAKRDQLQEITRAVAAALGGKWRPHYKDGQDHGAYILRPDGAGVWLCNTWAGDGRLAIHGHFENGLSDFRPWRQGGRLSHKITVSAARPAAQIAREIARRILPEYLPDHAATVAAKTKAEADRQEAYALAVELARILGDHAPAEKKDTSTGYSIRSYSDEAQGHLAVEIRPYGSAEFKIDARTPAEALALGRALAALRQTKQTTPEQEAAAIEIGAPDGTRSEERMR